MDDHVAGHRRRDRTPPDPLILRVGEDGSLGEPVLRSTAHKAPGVLHLAVSLQVVDSARQGWIIQRRSSAKLLFADRWANTCCTHPAPGEDPVSAAVRRLREETGLVVEEMLPAGRFTYRAVDGNSGLVEHEEDLVFVALADSRALMPDPDEIADVAVLSFDDALNVVQSPDGAPWAADVLLHCYTRLGDRH